MPNMTIFIRKEDLDKWRALENKSEVISNLLNADGTVGSSVVVNGTKKLSSQAQGPLVEDGDDPTALGANDKTRATFIPKPPDPETGYPCCTKARPCKHWEFDGADGLWTNTITGKTREVV